MTKAECQEVFALLSEYLDGELAPEVCRQMEDHIQQCPPCVEFLESLRKTTELCRQVRGTGETVRLPETVRDELLKVYRQVKRAQQAGG